MNQNSQKNITVGVGVATVVAAIGTYFALTHLGGKSTPEAAATRTEVPAVDMSTIDIGSGEVLTAEDAQRIAEQVAKQVAAEVAQSVVATAGGTTGASGESMTEEEARRIGEEEGRKAAEAALASLSSGGALPAASAEPGMTAEEAERIGTEAGRRVAEEVAANTAREVVRNSRSSSSAVSTSAESPSAPAAKPKKKAKPAESAGATEVAAPPASKSKPERTVASADALKTWWSKPASGEFGLNYAGQPWGQKAIALLFSAPVKPTALDKSAKVLDAKGKTVKGQWEAGSNTSLVLFKGLKPGRYTVVVGPELANTAGQSLGHKEHGPVYVQ